MFDADLFGKAAAEIMGAKFDGVAKELAALTARVTEQEKTIEELRKENAVLNEKITSTNATVKGCNSDLELIFSEIEEKCKPGVKGDKGDTGEKGDTGDGVADAFIDGEGKLVLTFTDGRTKTLGKVVGENGRDGRDGVDGKDGRDGVDGKDGAPGRDGVDGKDGAPGRDGVDGKDGVDGAAGKDGRDGVDGKDGAAGVAGRDGVDGKDGRDGVDGKDGAAGDSVKDAAIDIEGNLVLTFTDGRMKTLGKVVGKSFENFDIEYIPHTHEIVMRATCAGVQKTVTYPAGGIRPKGYWREGKQAKAGDAVSLGGHLYIARKDTTEKPSYTATDWFLAVQRGQDRTVHTDKIHRNPAEKAIPLEKGESDAGA